MSDNVLPYWLLAGHLAACVLSVLAHGHVFWGNHQATRGDLVRTVLVSLCPLLNGAIVLCWLYLLVVDADIDWDKPVWTRRL